MPQERGYEQQVAPGQLAGLPGASPAAFGAGVGQGIAELGGALNARKMRAYQLERQNTADAEAADFNARFAQAREDADKASIDARNAAAPGGAGHAETMAAWWVARRAALAEGITDDRVRRSAQGQLDAFGGRFDAAEYQFQEGARVGKLVTDTQSASDIAANRAYRQHDPKSFGEELTLGRAAIEAMPGVPADVKEKLIRQHDQTVSVGFLNGIVDTNPKAVGAILDSGQFDAILSPEQADRLRNGAGVNLRVQEAHARAEAAQIERDAAAAIREQQERAREEVAAINAKVTNGINPAAGEISRAQQAAAAAGLDPAEQINLGATGTRTAINRRYAGSDGDALRRARSAYSGQSEEDQVAMAHLDHLIDKADDEQAKEIAALKQQGSGGMVQALGMIRGSGERRYAVAEKLGKGMGYVSGLDGAAQRWTLEGKDILTARPREFGSGQQVQAALDRELGPLKAAVGGMYDDIRENAHQILAVIRNRKGATGFDTADMALAVRLATGASTRRDGTVQGGVGRVRGKPVILPDWQTAQELDATLARSDFSGAFHADRVPAGSGVAVMRATRPEWAGDDDGGNPFYRFVDASGAPLRTEQGEEFHLRFRRR